MFSQYTIYDKSNIWRNNITPWWLEMWTWNLLTHEILWGNTEIGGLSWIDFISVCTEQIILLFCIKWTAVSCLWSLHEWSQCLFTFCLQFFGNGLSSTRGYHHNPKLLSVWRYLWTKRKLNCHALYIKDYFLVSFTFIWNVIVANECK